MTSKSAGDSIGAGVDDSGNVTVGKRNMQQVVSMPDTGHNNDNDLWRAVQRVESKLDLALSEQNRLVQQEATLTHQMAMLAQQVAQITAQVTTMAGQIMNIQQAQGSSATTSIDRILVIAAALVMIGLFAFNVWAGAR